MDLLTVPKAPRREVRIARAAVLTAAVGAALWISSWYDYLLFHSLSEIFSIVVAVAVFMFSWNSRNYAETRPFVLLGVGYLFVAVLDTAHTFTYRGMSILPAGHDYATKLWVAARGLQALVTLGFVLLARLRRAAPAWVGFLVIGAVTAALLMSIFWWDVFPLCLVEGQGVTPFKKASEYAISAILALSILLLAGDHKAIVQRERNLLMAAFAVNIASEPFIFGYFATEATFRASGDTRTPLMLLAASIAANLVLDSAPHPRGSDRSRPSASRAPRPPPSPHAASPSFSGSGSWCAGGSSGWPSGTGAPRSRWCASARRRPPRASYSAWCTSG